MENTPFPWNLEWACIHTANDKWHHWMNITQDLVYRCSTAWYFRLCWYQLVPEAIVPHIKHPFSLKFRMSMHTHKWHHWMNVTPDLVYRCSTAWYFRLCWYQLVPEAIVTHIKHPFSLKFRMSMHTHKWHHWMNITPDLVYRCSTAWYFRLCWCQLVPEAIKCHTFTPTCTGNESVKASHKNFAELTGAPSLCIHDIIYLIFRLVSALFLSIFIYSLAKFIKYFLRWFIIFQNV